MADSTIDGETKIRLTQLGFIIAGVVSITTLLVSMQHDVSNMAETMVDVVKELKEHAARLDHIEWRTK
jgi:hypothetical protein